MEDDKICNTQFKYCCITNPEDEESIYIIGNVAQLGNWDITKGEKLNLFSKDNQIWITKENIKLPQNATIEYKYIHYKHGKFSHWENIEENKNRILNTENNSKIIIRDNENLLEGYIEKKEENLEITFIPQKRVFLEDYNPTSIINNKIETSAFLEPKISEDEYKELNFKIKNEINELIIKEDKLKSKEIKEITDEDEIIMCSYYLPFNITKNEKGEIELELTNYPLNQSLFRLIENKKNYKWFGSIRNYSSLKEEEVKICSKKLKEKNMYLIEIDMDTFNKNNILLKEILEPLFHYISLNISIIDEFSRFDIYWEAYKKMNEKLCDTIIPYLNEKSLIYLHDYHFFLVPSILYSRCFKMKNLQNISIGLFMHSPFPSHEFFKRIPFREEILKSMLTCSVIGFHSFDYSRNFLKSAKRLLNINYETMINGELAANYFDHTSIIKVKNATPEISLLKEDINSEIFKSKYKQLKEKYNGYFIYVSMDHMKFLSGIKKKLEGYEKFLENIKANGTKFVYLQYIRCSNDDLDYNGNFILDDSQREMLEQIKLLSQKIKNKFGNDLVEVIISKISYVERLAVFACANCFIRSSKQESFSLGIYEFLILKQLLGLDKDNEISYIISELSRVSTSLAGTIKINPFDYISAYNGFLKAFESVSEKDTKITRQKDFKHVMKSSMKEWLLSFLRDIKNSKLSNTNDCYYGVGEGLNFRLLKVDSNFKKLNFNELKNKYISSKNRLIFIGYDGNNTSSQNINDLLSKNSKPNESFLNTLKELIKDSHNTIYIVSGREKKILNEWFDDIKGLWIAAEHGFIYKNSDNNWTRTIKNYKNDWIKFCAEILEPYTEHCEDSFLEIKDASIVWQYSVYDNELGKSFAYVIASEMENIAKKLNLKIINGKDYLEIISNGISKGHFISYAIKEHLSRKSIPDFILCFGENESDEKMFQYLKYNNNNIHKYSNNIYINTVSLERKNSSAYFYLENQQEVINTLNSLIEFNN